VLEFDGLTKRFGPVTALDGCTFGVQGGRITGFLGPNGAGKTTAMRAVFGLVRPDSGHVRWRGSPVSHRERLRFGYLPEERGVYPKMRVRDQLSYFGRLSEMSGAAADAAADRWLERLGLADRAGERVEVLSHGNQQRFQLALAVINDPELLVLDEPFSGLDPLAVLQHCVRRARCTRVPHRGRPERHRSADRRAHRRLFLRVHHGGR
jgi:ABC-2 type transport system ATP-binding protein